MAEERGGCPTLAGDGGSCPVDEPPIWGAPAEPTAHRRPSPSPCSRPAASAAERRTHS